MAHRDQWWKRWSWVVDRAVSADEHDQTAAAIMATALTSRRWTTPDDEYMFDAVRVAMPWMEPRKDDDDLQDE
ncbi:hypothetical protein AAEP80_05240 [Curtobacterium sp. L3-7]|uniref:hypothetical protein n=1 Tax=Curtobacterium sp. L3-7 TaxID=3138787 RepID=UPI003B52F246